MTIDPISSSSTQPINPVTVNNVTFDKGLLQAYFLDAVSAYINAATGGSANETDAMLEAGLKNGISLETQVQNLGLPPPTFGGGIHAPGIGQFLQNVLSDAVASGKITQQQADAMFLYSSDDPTNGNFGSIMLAFRWPVYVQSFNG